MKEEPNGVMAIVFRRGDPNKFLLIHNLNSGNITVMTGGKEEFDETILETLKREMKEETGLKPKDYKIIETPFQNKFICDNEKSPWYGKQTIQKAFLIETEKTEILPEDSGVKFMGWFSAEEVLEKLTYDENKEVFKKVLKLIS